jgi:DNA-binding NtrC family response regulator
METPDSINVLFIENDTSYMAVAQQQLSKFQGKKFNILWKQSGAAALAELQSNPAIHVAIIEYYLPEHNGLEVVRRIRAHHLETPIIFVTSNRDFQLAIELMKYDIEDFIIKEEAVDHTVLPRAIVNVLERVYLKRRIAQKQKAELIARKRTDAIKELVVTVCHEFNNPLAAIKISTDILMRQELPDEEKKLVQELDRNIASIEKEITKLRDINFEKFDLTKSLPT